jgi:hypothetical protein
MHGVCKACIQIRYSSEEGLRKSAQQRMKACKKKTRKLIRTACALEVRGSRIHVHRLASHPSTGECVHDGLHIKPKRTRILHIHKSCVRIVPIHRSCVWIVPIHRSCVWIVPIHRSCVWIVRTGHEKRYLQSYAHMYMYVY